MQCRKQNNTTPWHLKFDLQNGAEIVQPVGHSDLLCAKRGEKYRILLCAKRGEKFEILLRAKRGENFEILRIRYLALGT